MRVPAREKKSNNTITPANASLRGRCIRTRRESPTDRRLKFLRRDRNIGRRPVLAVVHGQMGELTLTLTRVARRRLSVRVGDVRAGVESDAQSKEWCIQD